ncbi:MAG: FAD-dependent oxidoreductase [Gammaproteobacteria bacterium]
MSNTDITIDVAIIGGGIAGCWLLHTLRQRGYSAFLFEKNALGAGQTVCSQGIIHGGMKYALTGKLTQASQAIADMPTVWRDCLSGDGEIDLRAAKILSEHQYLFSSGQIGGTLMSFLASKALKSRVKKLSAESYPELFKHDEFKGAVYQLNEPVVNVPAVLQCFLDQYRDAIFQGDYSSLNIQAKRIIFTAGEHNEDFLTQYHLAQPKMQRRPLHMVYICAKQLPPAFAHCMQLSDKPRLTITTHRSQDGMVWYIGGDIAETGVHRKQEEQIAFAKKELQQCFPWLDLSEARWGSFFIDRAEMQQAKGSRPDQPCFYEHDNMVFAWPTKLAFAPVLAKRIVEECFEALSPDQAQGLEKLNALPKPEVASPIWSVS